MSKRSAKFVAALFVSVLAGAHLATVTDLRAQAATADDCLTAPKGATTAGSHWYYRIDRATKRQCWYLREEGRQVHPRHAAGFSAGNFGRSRGAGRAAVAHDHAQSDFRSARRIYLPAIPRRADPSCQSRVTNDRRSRPPHRPFRIASAPHRRKCARANPTGHDTMARRHGRECFKQSCRCPYRRRRRSVRRPTASRRRAGAATSPAATGAAQPAHGDYVRRGGLIDASQRRRCRCCSGDGCRARAGRHHGEPGLQAGPHPRSACHAASAACDVGSVKNKRSAPQPRSAPQTRAAPPARSAPPVRSAPADVPSRGSPGAAHRGCATTSAPGSCHNPRPQEARNPRPQEARERQVTDMLARLARSAQH